MIKKNILIFLLGAVSAGVIYGIGAWMFQRTQTVPTPLRPEIALSAPAPIPSIVRTAQAGEAPIPPSSVAGGLYSLPEETPLFKSMMANAADEHSVIYSVAAGDNLTAISRKHGVTVDLIKRTNGLASDRLAVGKKLKIPGFKFSVLVDKSDNRLYLNGDQTLLKTYVVSTGSHNSTPIGSFKVTDKLVDPTWYRSGAVLSPGDKENQLGTRWMGITAKGYGIHGTTEPEKLGQQVTAGCIRMKNEEVEELYSLIPAGTDVVIQD